MYKRILVAIENSPGDQTILAHVTGLARLTGAQLLLVHVADGFAARHFDDLKLRESEEMRTDRAYLEGLKGSLTAQGLQVDCELAKGDPATELIRMAECRRTVIGSCRTFSTARPLTRCGTLSKCQSCFCDGRRSGNAAQTS